MSDLEERLPYPPLVLEDAVYEAGGCRFLWQRMIYFAVFEYVKTRDALDIKKRKLHKDAKDWLFSNRCEYFTDYIHLCNLLDIRPRLWRDRALRLTPKELRQLELLGRRRARDERLQLRKTAIGDRAGAA